MGTSNDRRTFIVSNRLPVRVHHERGRVEVVRSSGGLASALRSATSIQEWIGWSGGPVPQAMRARVRELLTAQGLMPVFLTAEEERHYYVNMCNGTLWPLLHYFPGRVEFDDRSWPAYCEVNRRFADTVLERTVAGDRVWIHDFHLFLLPQLLREARPELEIGFFLHVPFPSSEIWRIVPQREELLRGLLGADYLSFHTADYLRHFRDSCLRVLGLGANPDSIQSEGRRVALGVDPLGPDVATFQAVLDTEAVAGQMAQFAQRWGDRRLLLSVERLDYTKGILHKLRSFARLLELEPERCQDTVMLQVLVPSREENESYRSLRREIEREVGRINGTYGSPGRMPLEFLHRSIDTSELAALQPFLTTPDEPGVSINLIEEPVQAPRRGVSRIARYVDGEALVVLVNEDDVTHFGTEVQGLDALKDRSLHLLYGNEKVQVVDGAFVTRMRPYEVKIFSTTQEVATTRVTGREFGVAE